MSELANYDVSISTAAGTTIAATGLAANDDNVYRYHLERARSFGFSASPDYARFDGTAGAVPIQLYVSIAQQPYAQVVMQSAIQAVALFEELYGEFPYPELVLAENGFLTSNEYSGFISLGGYLFDVYDRRPDSLLVAITVHEVAHQWWYGSVGNDQVHEPWLDEGMAMLSELFFYERYYPDLVDQWWQFRVDRWNPSGSAGASIYDFNDSASFVHNVYGQSAHFLQQLRQTMGDTTFKGFLRHYYQQNAGRLVTAETFFSLAQAHTPEDVSAVRALYFDQ
jgi:aminopeptidase N